MQRRLAAIMFTDIEGYTTIMQHNEQKAIQTREKHRRVFNSVTQKYKGRILQYYGDGTLSIFDSAIDAVECAIEMQLGFLDDPAIPVRIGIHTGDIIIGEEEIIGNGVNIASRIECLAVPGSVFISEKVYDEINNQESIRTSLMKTVELKNIDKPVDIYAISNDGLVVPDPEDIDCKSVKDLTPPLIEKDIKNKITSNRVFLAFTMIIFLAAIFYLYRKFDDILDPANLEKSIAVLPLDYLSEDQSKQYIAEGVLDAITGHLSTIDGLRVMPRTSVEQYRGTTKTVDEIGKELNVSYLIEGNFLIVNDEVSITIQLVTARTNDHLYYNEYRRDFKDIIGVQSEVARTIAKEINVAISPEALNRIDKVPTENMQAYDLYLRGRDAFNRYYLNRNQPDLENCILLFEQAIQQDSTFALPYAWLGRAIEYKIGQKIFFGYNENTIISLCNKALQLDPNLSDGYWIRGRYYRNTGQLDKAIADLKKAIEINPNNTLAYRYIGTTYFNKRDYINALFNLKKSEKLDRGNELTQLYSDIGQVYISVGDFRKAEQYYNESLRLQPNFIEGYRNLIWAKIRQGKFDEAYSDANKLLTLYPDNLDSYSIMAETLGNLKKYEQAEEYYRKWKKKSTELGVNEVFNQHRFAIILWMNGKKDEALELFDKHRELCENSIKSQGLYGKSLAAYDLAGIHAFLGEKKEAYKWLRKYEKDGFIWGYHEYILIDQLFESLHEDKEFRDIIKRVQQRKKDIREQIRKREEQEEKAFS